MSDSSFDSRIWESVVALNDAANGDNPEMGFNKFDQIVGGRLAEKPLEEWSPKMASIAYKMIKKYQIPLLDMGLKWEEMESPTPPARRGALRGRKGKSRRTIGFDVPHYVVRFDAEDKDFAKIRAAIKGIDDRRWDSLNKQWLVPRTTEGEKGLLAFQSEWDFAFDKGVGEDLRRSVEEADERVALSKSSAEDYFVPGLNPNEALMPYQKAGVKYAVAAKRVIIADEMGLGKTAQAIATVQKLECYPCLVVCPSTLKINWEREFRFWIDRDLAIHVISGGGSSTVEHLRYIREKMSHDVVILNFDIMPDWERDKSGQIIWQGKGRDREPIADGVLAELLKFDFKSMIIDEAHLLKSPGAQRTIAAKKCSRDLDVIIELTGTPFPNRPFEIVSLLDIIRRLEEFGGWAQFVRKYCGGRKTRTGWETSGASNLIELNRELRSRCYIRRLKKDVMKELPEKRRVKVFVEIDNRQEYELAQRNLMEWIARSVTDDAEFMSSISHYSEDQRRQRIISERVRRAAAAMRAEKLVEGSVLLRATAKGKLSPAIAWIKGFVESGEKLIVYAYHDMIQQGLARAFPEAPHIFASDSGEERQRAVDKFTGDPKCKLIICSIGAGGVGWDGTAASNVAMVEFDWPPGNNDQCEDRPHRFGQKNAVTAWYLIAANTRDEHRWAAVQAKRAITSAAADGVETKSVDVYQEFFRDIAEEIDREENGPSEKDIIAEQRAAELEKEIARAEGFDGEQ